MRIALKLLLVMILISGCNHKKGDLILNQAFYWSDVDSDGMNVDLEVWPRIRNKKLEDTCNYLFKAIQLEKKDFLPVEVKDSLKIKVWSSSRGAEVWLNGNRLAGRWKDEAGIFLFPKEMLGEVGANNIRVRVVDLNGEGGLLKGVEVSELELIDQLDFDLTSFYKLDQNGESSGRLIVANRSSSVRKGKLIVSLKSTVGDWKPSSFIFKLNLSPGERKILCVPVSFTTNLVAVGLYFREDFTGESIRLKETLNYVLHEN